MRRLILVLVLVLLLAGAYRYVGPPTVGRASPTLPGPAPNPGDPAPTFVHERYDGGTFELSDRGLYVITFWSTLNQDSNQAQPYFARLAEEFEGSGVRFAAVYVGNPPKDDEATPYAIIQDKDGSLANMYNVKRVPRTFVVSDGRIYLVQDYFLPENYELLQEALAGLTPPNEDGQAPV